MELEGSCLFRGLKVMCSGNCWGLMREAGKLCEKMENAVAAAVDRPWDLLQL